MRLKKCLKKIASVSLAVLMSVSLLSGLPTVQAGTDDYPDEITFPFKVFDFRADNLLFEWAGVNLLDLYHAEDNGGKGLVNMKLGENGLPEYTQTTVEHIAKYVQNDLNNNGNSAILDSPFVNSEMNPLSVRNYIRQDWCMVEAEYGRVSGSASVVQGGECSNGAFVDYNGAIGALDFLIYSSQAGKRRIFIYFASAENRNINVVVNGVNHAVMCQSNGSWAKPTRVPSYVDVDLKKGANTIRFTANNNELEPNLDRFAIVKQGFEYNVGEVRGDGWTRLEAEDGALNGSTRQNDATCSGGAYVNNIGGANNGNITFSYYCQEEGSYTVRLYYASDADRYFRVSSNDQSENVLCNDNNSWTMAGPNPAVVQFNLKAGLNDIVVEGLGGGEVTPNLDYIEVKSDNFYTVEAENCTLGAGTTVENGDANSNGKRVNNIGAGADRTVTFQYNSPQAGAKTIELFYASGEARNFGVTVNGGEQQTAVCNNIGNWQDTQAVPAVIQVNMQEGDNTIVISGVGNAAAPNLDKIQIRDYRIGDDSNVAFPLGKYEESKAKFDNNPSLGWTDMTTCMDYAYFVTSNFFRSNPSLNKVYDEYDSLIYHKIEDEDGKVAYEFMGDQHHKGDDAGLIFNPTTKTIRNGSPNDVQQGETRTDPGSMFIADNVEKQYPALDPTYKADDGNQHNFHYTMVSNSYFVYKTGQNQYFYFSGDDDVYVFVNGYLLVDLGGAHTQLDGEFNLDIMYDGQRVATGAPDKDGNVLTEQDYYDKWRDIDAKYNQAYLKPFIQDWGIKDDTVVSLDFFYMERHSTASNFYGKLNFKLRSDAIELNFKDGVEKMENQAIPYGYFIDLDYTFSSEREMTSNKKITFTDDLGNIIGADGFVLGDGVRLKDDKTIRITVLKQDGEVDEGRSREFTFSSRSGPVEGNAQDQATLNDLKAYFAELTLTREEGENGETLKLGGLEYDTATKKYDEFDACTRVFADPEEAKFHRVLNFEIKANYISKMNNSTNDEWFNSEATTPVTVEVVFGRLKVSAAVEDNMKKYIYGYGAFEVARLIPQDDGTNTEDVVYTNEYLNINDSLAITLEPEEYPLAQGDYKLNLDTTMLTGYNVSVQMLIKENGNLIKDVTVSKDKIIIKEDNKATKEITVNNNQVTIKEGDQVVDTRPLLNDAIVEIDGVKYSLDNLILDLTPKLDLTQDKWIYPEVEYILKANRSTNPLKDLT